MELLNWVYNKKEPDPDNPVDPAYIERLQDDMRIAVSAFNISKNIHVYLIIRLSLGSIETVRFISETVL